MPYDRDEWSGRIKDVERQYNTARFGAERLRADLRNDPTIEARSPEGLYVSDTLRDIEVTYLVRMFAVFESGLWSFWRSVKPNNKPRMEHLINNVASNRKISNESIVNTHATRTYRNIIVHDNEHDESVTPIPIAEARKYLALFFARLPFKW